MANKISLRPRFLLAILIAPVLLSCSVPQVATDLSMESIIPKPVSVIAAFGSFEITEHSAIYIPEGSEGVVPVAEYLAAWLRPATGFPLEIKTTGKPPKRGHIFLEYVNNDSIPQEEGYELSVSDKLLRISAAKPAGLFYGIQTLRQLLPAGAETAILQPGPWIVPTGTIRDYPEYPFRGAMLDVARHFFQADDVKRFIDLMAIYKMNILHLHLSDDQGWRIEIKSWPNLAIHGGSTQVGGGKGGFYTQEQYADIVAYAQYRFITIIPEIDMPGHTNAALASYPELNCNGKATRLYTGTNVGFSSLCTKREVTYQFITDVFRELSELTPGPWIHIGGDESHVTKLEDYIPFINRVQDIVEGLGKSVIGWDDIAIASLKPGAVAQHWSNVKNAQQSVAQGAKIIMSPARKAYLDMQYDSTTKLGLHWAGYIEVDTAYLWDPATLVPGIEREHVLGIEAPLWSETVTNMEEIEYMVFPRLPGYAEIGWTPSTLRSWDDYKLRLARHGVRFTALGIDYYRSGRVAWE